MGYRIRAKNNSNKLKSLELKVTVENINTGNFKTSAPGLEI